MKESADREWLEWIAIQSRALRLMVKRELSQAMTEVDEFLKSQPSPDLASEALAFRADIREQQGQVDQVLSDLLEARSLTPSASYRRYTIELSLAATYEKAGRSEEAVGWYLAALDSSAQDPTTSGASALAALLTLRDFRDLDQPHRDVCRQVARQAWNLFRLPGEPDLEDLKKTAQVLSEASSRPLSR